MQGWVGEHPDTAAGVIAVLDLVALIVAHLHRWPFVEESLIVAEDRDLAYVLQLINGVRNWANEIDIEDCAARIRRERQAQS